MIMPIAKDKSFFEGIKNEAENVNNLEFIPGVSFSDVEDYYRNAKVFVNTSLAEGFPNSFNQAMNSSTPLLSLNINPDDFILKNQVGLYSHNDFDELKENLDLLIDNQELWNKCSENSYTYVYNEMNIEKSIKKWKKIIFYLFQKKIKERI